MKSLQMRAKIKLTLKIENLHLNLNLFSIQIFLTNLTLDKPKIRMSNNTILFFNY